MIINVILSLMVVLGRGVALVAVEHKLRYDDLCRQSCYPSAGAVKRTIPSAGERNGGSALAVVALELNYDECCR